MYTASDIESIKNIVIATVPAVDSIFLFGSYAEGTAREQSDIDIAILLRHELNWRERNSILNRLYEDTARQGYDVDFLLKLVDKFRADSSQPTLSRVISREGKLLWKRD